MWNLTLSHSLYMCRNECVCVSLYLSNRIQYVDEFRIQFYFNWKLNRTARAIKVTKKNKRKKQQNVEEYDKTCTPQAKILWFDWYSLNCFNALWHFQLNQVWLLWSWLAVNVRFLAFSSRARASNVCVYDAFLIFIYCFVYMPCMCVCMRVSLCMSYAATASRTVVSCCKLSCRLRIFIFNWKHFPNANANKPNKDSRQFVGYRSLLIAKRSEHRKKDATKGQRIWTK